MNYYFTQYLFSIHPIRVALYFLDAIHTTDYSLHNPFIHLVIHSFSLIIYLLRYSRARITIISSLNGPGPTAVLARTDIL